MPADLPVLAAGEASKLPFFLAGGALAAWAVALSAVGLRRPNFPGGRGASFAVMGFTGLLMVATMATGIAVSRQPHEAQTGQEGLAGGRGEPTRHDEGQAGGTPGGNPATPGQTGQRDPHVLVVSADPSGALRFEQQSLSAKPGRVRIQFSNQSPVTHDVKVERRGRTVGGTRQLSGGDATATVDLRPGSYMFFCSVAGHREAGMEGPLRVR